MSDLTPYPYTSEPIWPTDADNLRAEQLFAGEQEGTPEPGRRAHAEARLLADYITDQYIKHPGRKPDLQAVTDAAERDIASKASVAGNGGDHDFLPYAQDYVDTLATAGRELRDQLQLKHTRAGDAMIIPRHLLEPQAAAEFAALHATLGDAGVRALADELQGLAGRLAAAADLDPATFGGVPAPSPAQRLAEALEAYALHRALPGRVSEHERAQLSIAVWDLHSRYPDAYHQLHPDRQRALAILTPGASAVNLVTNDHATLHRPVDVSLSGLFHTADTLLTRLSQPAATLTSTDRRQIAELASRCRDEHRRHPDRTARLPIVHAGLVRSVATGNAVISAPVPRRKASHSAHRRGATSSKPGTAASRHSSTTAMPAQHRAR